MGMGYFRATVELPPEGDESIPVRIKLEMSPMPIFFAYKLDTLLPSAEYQLKQERKRAIFSMLDLVRAELESAFRQAELKLLKPTTEANS
jgi:hypothetical protein